MDVFDLVATLRLDTSGYEQSLGEAEKDTKSFGSKLSSGLGTAVKVGGAAVAAASTAVVAFGKSAVDAGKSFDSSMSQVAATMGYSSEELNAQGSEAAQTFSRLSEFAQKMGSETAFSATEAADALNFMALAGYDADTSISMLPNVLNLAAAGGMELATASDMITDGQSALGLSIEETTELVDKMAKASSKSNTSVSQLGDAILTIGGTAKNLTGGTTELATALGILADNGIKGSEGGTALRNILMNLTPKSEDAAAAMEQIGLQAYDANGEMRPLADIFRDMNGQLSKMSTQERTNILSNIFNKVDLKSVNALLSTNAERWDELSDAIDNSSGSAQNMAEVQLDNLAGDITLFQSALEGAKIAISEQLTPTLREFVNMGSEGLSKVTQAFKEGGLEGAMESLGDWLGDAIMKVVDMAPKIVSAGAKLLETLVKGLIRNLPQIAKAAIKIIVELANGLSKSLPELIPAVVDAMLAIVDALIDNLPLLVDAALKLMVGFAKGLIKALPKIIEKIPDIIEGIVNALIDSIDLIIDAGVELFVALVENMPAIIRGIVKALPRIISAILNGLSKLGGKLADLFTRAWEGIKNVFANVGGWFKDTFEKAVVGIKVAFAVVGQWFADRWEDIKNVFAGVGEWFAGVFSSAWEGIVGIFSGIGQWFADRWQDIVNVFTGIAGWFSGIFTDAYDGITGVFKNIAHWFGNIWESIKNVFSGAWNAFMRIGGQIIDGLKAGVTHAWDEFINFFGDLMGGIQGIAIKTLKINSPSKVFAEIGKFIDLGLAEGIADNIYAVEDAVEDLADATADGDYFRDQEIQTVSASVIGDGGSQMFEVPRYNAPQYLNLTVELGGQKVKSVIYEMVQEESSRVGLKLVKGAMA